LNKAFIEGLNYGIEAYGGQSGHVEGAPNLLSSSPYKTFSPEYSAVSVKGCHSHQSGNLSGIECSKFWKGCQKDRGSDGSNPLEALEDGILFSPDRGVFDEVRDLLVNFTYFSGEPIDMVLDGLCRPFGGLREAVPFRGNHLNQLATPDIEGMETLGLFIPEGTDFRTDSFGKVGDDFGVDPVCLGQRSKGLCKVADMTSIDYHDRKRVIYKSIRSFYFKSSCGLQDNQSRGKGFEEGKHLGDSLLRISEDVSLSIGSNINLEFLLGNINTYESFFMGHNTISSFPALQNTGSLKRAQATVRVKEKTGCDDPRLHTSFSLKVKSVCLTQTKSSLCNLTTLLSNIQGSR